MRHIEACKVLPAMLANWGIKLSAICMQRSASFHIVVRGTWLLYTVIKVCDLIIWCQIA